jgi:hypothetical protein
MKRGWPFLWIVGIFAWTWSLAAEAQSGGRWWRAESPNFIVYARHDGQARAAAQSLEDLDATLRILLEINAPQAANKLEVFLVSGLSELQQVSPNIYRDAAGFYSASPGQVAAFVVADDTGLSRREILFHEYAHHFMLHYAPQAYPSWYIEGWAEFVSNFSVRGRRVTVGEPSEARAPMLASRLLPIEHLLTPERVERRDTLFMQMFYAQSWLAATYIINHPERAAGMLRYVDALGTGGDPIGSFASAFGITPVEFESELSAYRRGRAQVGTIQLPTALATISVTRLPRSADDLLLATARLRYARDDGEQATEFAATVERLAAQHAGDPFAERAWARALLLRGDTAGARARLEPLLANDDSDAEARLVMALTFVADAQSENASAEQANAAVREARRHFIRAFRASPDYVPNLFYYASTFADQPTPMTEEQLNVLARAMELAPQVTSIRLSLARELMRAGEYDAAVIALRPEMYSTHSRSTSDYARALAAAALRRELPRIEEPKTRDEEERSEPE